MFEIYKRSMPPDACPFQMEYTDSMKVKHMHSKLIWEVRNVPLFLIVWLPSLIYIYIETTINWEAA